MSTSASDAPACFTLTSTDLSLLHHWTRTASRTIVPTPHAHELWQDIFPHIGFKHPFVLHAILSLSALHLAEQDPAEHTTRHLHDAVQRHNEAVRGFQDTIRCLPDVSDGVCEALFACASINIVVVLCMYTHFGDQNDTDTDPAAREQRILGATWIPMIRGVQAVLEPTYDRVRLGPLAPMLHDAGWATLDPHQSPVPEDEHYRRLQSLWAFDSDRGMYDQTLHELRKCYIYTKEREARHGQLVHWADHPSCAGAMMWVQNTSDSFFARLNERRPAALLVFGYLGPILHLLENQGYWFLKTGGRKIVQVVSELLGPSWKSWMKWPREEVGLG